MADNLKNTKDFIITFGKSVEQEIKTRLLNSNKKATGKLYKSIKFNYRDSVKELEVSWRMEDYGLFVDGGVKGSGIPNGFKGKRKPLITVGRFAYGSKMPPESALKNWLNIKGLDKSLSFPIRRSIWIFGIAPTNFWTIPTTRRQKQYEKGLEKAFEKDLDIELQKQLNKK